MNTSYPVQGSSAAFNWLVYNVHIEDAEVIKAVSR